jgi:hypothetical protein
MSENKFSCRFYPAFSAAYWLCFVRQTKSTLLHLLSGLISGAKSPFGRRIILVVPQIFDKNLIY